MDLISNYRSGSIRNLSLTLIMLLVILLEVVVSSILFEKEKSEILERHYNELHKIEMTYNSILNDRLLFYKKRIECVLSCTKVISAIRDNNRENLYKYALPKWQILKEENRFLQVMHFHLPDGTSLLRMHRPDVYKDNIADIREMLQYVHKNRKFAMGLERGIFYTTYRVILPIVDKGEYLGALELGFRTEEIIEEIIEEMRHILNINGFVLANSDDVYQFQDNNLSIDKYSLLYSTTSDLGLLTHLQDIGYKFQKIFETEFNRRNYLIHSIEVFNFLGKPSIQNIIYEDITGDIKLIDQLFNKISISIVLLTIIIYIVIRAIVVNMENRINKLGSELITLFNTVQDGIVILDRDTNFIMANRAYTRISGFSSSELKKITCLELTPPEDLEKTKEIIQIVLNRGYYRAFNKRCVTKSGRVVDLILSFSLMQDGERIVVSVTDITKEREREEKIRNYLSIINNNILTVDITPKGDILKFSRAFAKRTKYQIEDLSGENIDTILIGMDHGISEKLKRVGAEWKSDFRIKIKESGYFWSEVTAHKTHHKNQSGYTLIHKDITDKKLVEELSITDELTTLYNRRYFNKLIVQEINRARREETYLSFAILDIDHFKQYNDTYGHQKGDYVLNAVGTLLNSCCSQRASDFAFRLGGEEFGVIFSKMDLEKSKEFANIIRNKIDELKIEHIENIGVSKFITVSIGLVVIKCGKKDISDDEIYRVADEQLYLAKENGRNRVETTLYQ